MRYIQLLIIISILLFSSCKKAKENKLIGEWRLLPRTIADRNDTIVYRFESNHVLYKYLDGNLIDTGDYQVKSEFFKYYLIIRNIKFDDGNYYIEKINKKVLILQCYSPFMRKELVRNE